MFTPNVKPSLLALSFEKEIAELSFYEFEKNLIYGVSQTLKYITPLQFLDFAVPANRQMLQRPFSGDSHMFHLRRLANEHQSQYVLYGALEPEVGPTGYLDGINLEVYLFDCERNKHLFQLNYYYTAFDGSQPQPQDFAMDWEGFQNMVYWLSFQIFGVLYAEHAFELSKKAQSLILAKNLSQFQRLASAHYLGGEGGMVQKQALLYALSKEEPQLFLPHLELGYLYKRQSNYTEALLSLEIAYHQLVYVSPLQAALCATEIGVCYALASDINQACQWWTNAIGLDPTLLNPYMNLAHCLEERGETEEAEQLFLKAAEIEPEDSRIYFNLARLYSKLEQWDKVIEQYEHQLLLEPENPWVCSNLANCYLQKSDIAKAKSYLLRTFELDPQGEAGKCASFILSNLQEAKSDASSGDMSFSELSFF